MIKGDTPNAACYSSPEVTDYRTAPHNWRPLSKRSNVFKEPIVIIEVCDSCGSMKKINAK